MFVCVLGGGYKIGILMCDIRRGDRKSKLELMQAYLQRTFFFEDPQINSYTSCKRLYSTINKKKNRSCFTIFVWFTRFRTFEGSSVNDFAKSGLINASFEHNYNLQWWTLPDNNISMFVKHRLHLRCRFKCLPCTWFKHPFLKSKSQTRQSQSR